MTSPMSGRLPSGSEPLDTVLGGGLPANAISMIMGLPGSGKTILAQQYVFRNGTPERPAVYFSTASEPLEKIVRFGQSLEFFDPAQIGRSVRYEDLGAALASDGLPAVSRQIAAALTRYQPGLVVIDSFKALHPFAASGSDFRRFLQELAGRLSAVPVAALWLGEYAEAEIGSAPEFAVADAIVQLATERFGLRDVLGLRVRKLRGSGFLPGRHSCRISSSGVQVFPRLADVPDAVPGELGADRVSSGINGFDGLLGGGYWPGSTTLVAGPSGAGKSLMGLHYITEGARRSERGIIATLQQNRAQLAQVMAGFGWRIGDRAIEIRYRSPVDIYIDEWADDLFRAVARTGATRLVLDSLTDLRTAALDAARFREFLYSLLHRLSRLGVTTLVTLETSDLFAAGQLPDDVIPHLADNVILLSYVRQPTAISRALCVLKTRASQHQQAVRPFAIGPSGITLLGG